MTINVKSEDEATPVEVRVDPAQPGADETAISVHLDIKQADLITLAEAGGEMVLNPQAEDAIIKLLELQTMVDSTVAFVKDQIVAAGQELDPQFSTVVGDKLKANYQFSGAKYKLQPGRKEFPAPLFKREVKVSIDSKAMEKYETEHRRLPKYVERAVRKQNLQFKVRG